MASLSSNAPIVNPLIGQAIFEKLTKANNALWRAQILTMVKGACLEGYLTGAAKAPTLTVKETQADKEVDDPNPTYTEWAAIDQQVLGLLLTSMTRDIMSQVVSCPTTAESWSVIEAMYSSVTKACSIKTRIALATTTKGNLSTAESIGKMRSLANEMAHSGKPLDNDELISYIIAGLDEEYNPVVTALIGRIELVWGSLCSTSQF